MRILENIEELKTLVGQEIGISEWTTISQDRINKFADATGDHQWIHIDVERAKNELPGGTTIAHGFLTLSETAEVLYKTTDYYAPHHERCLYWSDSDIGINWPECGATVSEKDEQGILLHNAEVFD